MEEGALNLLKPSSVFIFLSNEVSDEAALHCIIHKLLSSDLSVIVLINGLQNLLNTRQQNFLVSLETFITSSSLL